MDRKMDARAYMLTVQIRLVGEQLEKLIDQLFHEPNVDGRWVSIGQTDLQKGIMALDRAVRQPGGF